MWLQFFAAMLIAALILYVPGALLASAFRMRKIAVVASAPLLSIAVLELLAIAYSALGVSYSWVTAVVPAVVACLLLMLISHRDFLFGRMSKKGEEARSPLLANATSCAKEAAIPFLYVVIGVVVVGFVFIRNLDGPESVLQEYDNVHHLGLVATFLSTGDYSPLHTSLFSTEEVTFSPLGDGREFYPSAWHTIVALVSGMLDAPISLCANAVNSSVAGVIFPLGVYSLLSSVFPEKRVVVASGSIVALGFAAFPWGFLIFGPLYPNLLGFALVPASALNFVLLLSDGLRMIDRVSYGMSFALCLIALALSQPNAVFAAAVLLAPYCVYRVMDFMAVRTRKRMLVVASGLVACLAIAIVWIFLYLAPFMRSVVSNTWGAVVSEVQAIQSVVLVSYAPGFLAYEPGYHVAQLFLAAVVLVGIVYCIGVKRYRWLVFAYCFAAIIFVVDISTDGFLKHLLSGFWYTDKFRTAALLSISSIPLASIGIWVVASCLGRAIASTLGKVETNATVDRMRRVGVAATVFAFVFINYSPNLAASGDSEQPSAFGSVAQTIEEENSLRSELPYSPEEASFVSECLNIIPEDSLIINLPNDGSVFAYSLDDANVYYRIFHGYGSENETSESRLIRESLCDISSLSEVKDAVASIGAEYVIKLDLGESKPLLPYDEEQWRGIGGIDDETPGFELVLSEGDMRLYKIADV